MYRFGDFLGGRKHKMEAFQFVYKLGLKYTQFHGTPSLRSGRSAATSSEKRVS